MNASAYSTDRLHEISNNMLASWDEDLQYGCQTRYIFDHRVADACDQPPIRHFEEHAWA